MNDCLCGKFQCGRLTGIDRMTIHQDKNWQLFVGKMRYFPVGVDTKQS